MKNILIFLTGALGYGIIELLWRGYTHPSMLLTGGICLLIIWYIASFFSPLSLFKKSLLSAFSITAVEIIAGLIVNIILKLDIWDYSNLRFNLLGQVCLLYSVLWFFLSAGIIYSINFIKRRLE